MKVTYVIKDKDNKEKVKVCEKEYSKEFDSKLNEICANCGYARISHEMKPIYMKRSKLMGDRKTIKILKQICDNFTLGDLK